MIRFMREVLVWIPELRRRLYLGILLKVLETVFMGAPYGFLFLVLNDLLTDALTIRRIVYYTLGAIACFMLQGIFCYFSNRTIWPIANQAVKNIRLMLGEHLRKLSMGYFTGRSTGSTVSLVSDEMQMLHLIFYQSFPDFIVSVSFGILGPLVLFWVNWRLALVVALVIIAIIPFLAWQIRVTGKRLKKRSEALSVLNGEVVEYVQGMSVLKAYNRTGRQFERFFSTLKRFREVNIRCVLEGEFPIVASRLVSDLGIFFILLFGIPFFTAGVLTVSELLIFLVFGLRVYEPIKLLVPVYGQLKLAEPPLVKVREIMETPELQYRIDGPIPQRSDIEFDRVSFGYSGNPVVNDISFSAQERTITALVGPSGSGKTTLTNLIARFWDIDSGTISIGGCDIKDIDTDTLLSWISMVFQDVYLFNDTVFQNIAYGSKNADREQIIEAAKTAQCHGFIQQLPNGYDTIVGEGGATLSGGERQRISIARAILKDAPIILLDEATASVDSENEYRLQQAINALVESKTLIIIAHRLSTITSADQILVLNGEGRIEEVGTHVELLSRDGLYNRLWETRSQAKKWQLATDA